MMPCRRAFRRNSASARVFTSRMFTQRYTAQKGWHDAMIGPYRPLALDPAAEVFHCGQMIFDGTKAYRRPDGNLNLFRVEKNAERFNNSASRMAMPQSGHRGACSGHLGTGAARAFLDAKAGRGGSLYPSGDDCHREHARSARQPRLSPLHHPQPRWTLLFRRLQADIRVRFRPVRAHGARRHRRSQDPGQLRRQPGRDREGTRGGISAGSVARCRGTPLRGRSRRHEHCLCL